MISKQLAKLAGRISWEKRDADEMIFGNYNDYLFSVLDGKGFKAFITPIAGIKPDDLAAIRIYLDQHEKELRLFNYEISDNFLCVRIKERLMPMSSDQIEAMLGHLSGILSLYDVPADTCIICGQETKTRGLFMALYCSLHAECKDKEMIDFTAGQASQPGTRDDEEQPDAGSELEPEAEVADTNEKRDEA